MLVVIHESFSFDLRDVALASPSSESHSASVIGIFAIDSYVLMSKLSKLQAD